jgi:large subunit ribosomal protein L10
MALTRDQKVAQVKDLTQKMEKATSVVFAHYLGLTVAQITKLRSHLKKEGAEMKVAKKNLIQIAAKEAKAPEVTDDMLPGDIACIFSYEEPTAGPGAVHKFAKDHPFVQLVGGIFEGKTLTKSETISLATVPSRQQLLGMFAGMIQSPLSTFVRSIGSPLTSFARAMSEYAKKTPAVAAPSA